MTYPVESGNHYCIGLKANQKTLLQASQTLSQSETPLSRFQALDTTHGRTVERTVAIFAAPERFQQHWCGLAAIAHVQRQGTRQGKSFHTDSWYLLSQVIPAEQAAALIRNHRASLENQVHWVRDVVQSQDASLIQSAHPAQFMALLRSWTISSFRAAGHHSITKAQRLFKHDLPKLLSFLWRISPTGKARVSHAFDQDVEDGI
ncbi:ISAs1 family transposase [Leptolyngbya sp. AN03gr2]|uniref:ISAs1 family transposase n=1 Tax=unclassified Leptolyngbya TaxID=2650499 RepID=UPI003D315B42